MSSMDREASFLSRIAVLGGLAALAAVMLMPLSAGAQTFLAQWSVQGGGVIAVSPNDILYVASSTYPEHTQRYTTDGTLIPERADARWWSIGPELSGIAVDPNGNVWYADAGHVASFNFDGSADGPTWPIYDMTSWHEPFSGGIAVDALGRVCVLVNNAENTRVELHSLTGTWVALYHSTAGRGIAADHLGNLYVSDSDHAQVVEYSSTGTLVRQWGSFGNGPGQFSSPWSLGGIAVGHDGNVYVVDSGNYRVQVFSPDGVYLSQFGSQGTGPGQFAGPYGIAIDALGNVYVSDPSTNRIEKFGTLPTPVNTKTWGALKARYR